MIGYIQSKSKEPKIRSVHMQGQEMTDVPAQTEKANVPFPCLVVLFRPSSRVTIKYLCFSLWFYNLFPDTLMYQSISGYICGLLVPNFFAYFLIWTPSLGKPQSVSTRVPSVCPLISPHLAFLDNKNAGNLLLLH